MTIRSASEKDIPGIVNLLKASLGESLMPKSEHFWRWKHIDNPFGQSPVLLAFDGDKLVGVRAFMRWEWMQGKKIYKAVRAVDTATHPQYQGSGIFRKLTLSLVNQCQEDGVAFIFNTPNKISKPGYIKMGWQSLGRMPLQAFPVLSVGKRKDDFEIKYGLNEGHLKSFFSKSPLYELQANTTGLSTHHTSETIHWRYKENPNVSYYMFEDEESGSAYITLFRLKPSRIGLELRICDAFFKSPSRIYKEHLLKVALEAKAQFITFSGQQNLFPLSLRFGPEITMRQLTTENFLSFRDWKPTLGDMEVF